MKNTLRVRYLLLTMALTGFAVMQASAQMKIGNNPTQIHPFSILELESSNQGLRLTQVADTADVDATIGLEAADVNDMSDAAVIAAEGLMVYQTKDKTIYMRTNGSWKKVASTDDSGSGGLGWDLTGNTGTDSSANFFGTTDNMGMRIGTNGNAAIAISRDGTIQILDSLWVAGNSAFDKDLYVGDSLNVAEEAGFDKNVNIADSLNVGGALHVADSVTLETVRKVLPTDEDLLIISPDGTIRKMDMVSLAGIRSIAGMTGPDIHLEVAVNSDSTDFSIDSTSTANNIIFNVPYASTSKNGMVSTAVQAFAGAKSFRDSIAVGTADAPNATLDVQGNVNMKTVTTTAATYDMSTTGNDLLRTLIVDVSTKTSTTTVTLPDASTIDGRVYTIKKIGDAGNNQLDAPVEINTSATESFGDGKTSTTIYNNWSSLSIQALDAKWYIVGH